MHGPIYYYIIYFNPNQETNMVHLDGKPSDETNCFKQHMDDPGSEHPVALGPRQAILGCPFYFSSFVFLISDILVIVLTVSIVMSSL